MQPSIQAENSKRTRISNLIITLNRDKYLMLLVFPAIVYFLIFSYLPMIGNIMAFQSFKIGGEIFTSQWVGLRWFREFFSSPYAERTIKNTMVLSLSLMLFSFPAPIIFALMLNEVKSKVYKSIVQTVSYMPYFVSLVVVVGIVSNLLAVNDGIINIFLKFLGMEPIDFMSSSFWFRPIYVLTDIWQTCGWASIIYLASLAAIDPQLYEAAYIDGAGRWKQLIHITLPSIAPTIIMMLILRSGSLMSIGFEKIMLMYAPVIYDVSDVIQTYVYRRGLVDMQYSYAAAVGLFNSVVNFALIMIVNQISKRVSQVSLW